jgi:hypothetical protein
MSGIVVAALLPQFRTGRIWESIRKNNILFSGNNRLKITDWEKQAG